MTMPLAAGSIPAGLYPPTVTPPKDPLPLGRLFLSLVRNPILSLPQAVYEEPIVVHDNGHIVIAWITDPALVEQVLLHDSANFTKTPLEKRVFAHSLGDGLVTSEGATWRWQRRTAAPLFRPADLASLVPKMVAPAEQQIARWRRSPAGSVQPIEHDMTEVSFDIISATILAGSADAEAAAILEAAETGLASISWDIAAAMLNVPEWLWYPGKYKRRNAAHRMRAAVASILARRRSAGLEGSDDLLARLALARDTETGEPMSERHLVDNLITFLGAGHETTAKALTWALYLLARAPQWQEQILAETVAAAGKAPLRAEHLEQLPVTRAVLNETMRLYPPVPIMTRQAAVDTRLGPAAISAGTLIMIPIFATHRHRRLWDDPDRFDPGRFALDKHAKRPRTQFMPFGFGSRTCIGATFAMMEAVAALATLVRGARFEWDGVHAPEPLSRVTLRPRGGMPLKVWPLAGPGPCINAAGDGHWPQH
jgi:cytochrome P450